MEKIANIFADSQFMNCVNDLKTKRDLNTYDGRYYACIDLYNDLKHDFSHFTTDATDKQIAKLYRCLANTYFGLPTENGKTAWLAYREFTGEIPPRAEKKIKVKKVEPKAEPKVEPKAEPKVEPKAEPKVEPKKNDDKNIIRHADFDMIVSDMQDGINPYLFGPAGTGKTELAMQIAKELELPFYMETSVQDKYALTGFVDANGNFQETEFYKAFVNGGVFLWDEVDSSSPEACVAINTALANKRFTFAGVGQKVAHKDFHIIGAGNTIGKGADAQYTGRYALDVSTLNRFIPYKVDYDKRIEMSISHNDEKLIEFVHCLRDAIKASGIDAIISYRNINYFMLFAKKYDVKIALEKAFIGTLDADSVNTLKGAVNELKNNKYAKAFANCSSLFE